MKPLKLEFEAFLSYKNKTIIDFTLFDNSLFLIDGNTGAGKTTIFDAMCFALYGETTDSTRSTKYKSDFVDNSVQSYVKFEFEQEGKVYAIERKPSQIYFKDGKPRKGADPNKTKNEEICFTADGITYTNIKEANKEIINIIKFDVNQFRQTMMIAQGKFTDLIRANSDKRVELLRNILQTERFVKFTDELEKKKKDAYKEINETNIKIDTVLTQFESSDEMLKAKLGIEHPSNNDFDILSTLIEKEIKDDETKKNELKKAKTEAENRVNTKSKEIEKVKIDNDNLDKFNKNKLNFEALNSQIEDYKAKENKVKVYNDSSKVLIDYNSYIDKEDEIKKKNYNLIKTNQKLKELEPEFNSAKLNLDTIPIIESKKNLNTEKITEYKTILEAFNDKEKTQKDLDNKTKELEKKDEEFNKTDKKINQIKENIKPLQEYINNNLDVDSKLVDIDNTIDNKKKGIDDLEKYNKEYENYLKEKATLETLKNNVKIKENDFTNALTKFHNAKYQYELDIAGVLASELEIGKECPVCGSKDHPHPHVCTSSSTITKENVDELDKKREAARNDLEEARKNETAKIASLKTTITSIYNSLKLAESEDIQVFIDTKINNINTELDGLNNAKKNVEAIKGKIKSNKELIESKNKEIEMLTKEVEKLTTEINELKMSISSINGRLERVNKLTEGKVKLDVEKDKTLLENSNKELEKTIGDFRTIFQNITINKAKIEESIANLNKEIPEVENKKKDLFDKYNESLNKSILKNIEKIKECINSTTENEIEALDKQVTEFNTKYASAKALYDDNIKNGYDKLVKVDIKVLEDEKNELDKNYDDLDRQFNDYNSKLNKNKPLYENYKYHYESNKEKSKKYKALNDLYIVASGQVTGTEKTDFEQYYQALIFDNILRVASNKLSEMTGGKFRMQRHDSKSLDKSKSKILDIDIFDTTTGKFRESSSLSGGETFMAALSLALGLADISKSTSGARELNCMFIDEGFGSLDPESLNYVIKVLKNLSCKNNRMIGIISHVESIGEQVSKKINVSKNDENGSTLEIVA